MPRVREDGLELTEGTIFTALLWFKAYLNGDSGIASNLCSKTSSQCLKLL